MISDLFTVTLKFCHISHTARR